MTCDECNRRLQDHVDDELRPADARAVETHLETCAACRARADALRGLLASIQALPREIPPSRDLWGSIREQLAARGATAHAVEPESAPAHAREVPSPRRSARPGLLGWFAPLAVAASAVFFATLAEQELAPRAPGWAVETVAGAPRVGTKRMQKEATLRLGQWLETDATSRARVAVGSIGEVDVGPNSRLQLVGATETNHRLQLARGTLSAFITAPPRLFFVDTPSATAVDLGCAYTLTVDQHGNGELHVTSGYVSLEDRGRTSILRLGMMCLTRAGHGPGTPFAEGASDGFRAALTRFDFGPDAGATALHDVLARAGADDAVTLWHLLSRTKDADCAAVFDALSRLAPPPASVTREGILAGSPAMLRAWASELGLDRF